MNVLSTRTSILLLLVAMAAPAYAMEIEWARMTGQHIVETGPVLGDLDRDGTPEIVAINRVGQVMLWRLDGTDLGAGQDGTAAQLPEDRWTTPPTLIDDSTELRLLACGADGLVAALDPKLAVRWQYKLPGKTTWGRAIPTRFQLPDGPAYCLGDQTGTITCLRLDGSVAWSKALTTGPCQAPLQTFTDLSAQTRLLASAGPVLYCLDTAGNIAWQTDLGGAILSRPEVLTHSERQFILCAAGEGSLIALSSKGEKVWQAPVGDAVDATISFYPRNDGGPLILCTGVWGNLYAFNMAGQPVWTALFRSKTRTQPLIADVDGDGTPEILVSTYGQHLYSFDADGCLVDDLRLNGTLNAPPLAVHDAAANRTDFLLTTGNLLAYRIRPGLCRSPFGETPEPAEAELAAALGPDVDQPGLVIKNPRGALLKTNLTMTNDQGLTRVLGCISARAQFELPLPDFINEGAWSLQATVRDAHGETVAENRWTLAAGWRNSDKMPEPGTLAAWATAPYAAFDENRLRPYTNQLEPGHETTVALDTLYRGETDQAAFVVASPLDASVRVRIACETLRRDDGTPFAGTLTLRQVIPTATFNGEPAYDALPELGDAGLVTIPPKQSVKMWMTIEARDSQPGAYQAKITLTPLTKNVPPQELTLRVTLPDLALPVKFPLRLCTWDYVPNQWFPENTAEVLDDMARHGVDVFPRSSCVPPATADAAGQLTIDWAALDKELERLKGRGQFLLQVGPPAIAFAAEPAPELRHQSELAYLRALRDHLKEHGLNYADYAFYPNDEPGLDYGINSVPSLIKAASLFREADPQLRVYTDPVPGLCWADFQRLKPLIDVWCPNMRLVSGLLARDPRIEEIMRSGKPVWSYECVAQGRSLSPLRYNRANAWRGYCFGLQGIGFWTHCTTTTNPWNPPTSTEEEFPLVYPGPKPIPSARWEAVRDGMEDVAALKLLEDAIAAAPPTAKPEAVAQAREVIRLARADILELCDPAFVETRDYLRQGDRRLWHTWTDVQAYAQIRARIAQATLALRAP